MVFDHSIGSLATFPNTLIIDHRAPTMASSYSCTTSASCAALNASLYLGQTESLDERVRVHNMGRGPRFTRMRRPVALVYSEDHDNRAAAMNRERQVKRWTRAKKEALVAGDFAALKKL
jgi:predicted GIY-YIG superfamily endonuclease